MNDKIKEELQQGEKLLWTGKTEAFEILDTTHKKHIIQSAATIPIINTAFLIICFLCVVSRMSKASVFPVQSSFSPC